MNFRRIGKNQKSTDTTEKQNGLSPSHAIVDELQDMTPEEFNKLYEQKFTPESKWKLIDKDGVEVHIGATLTNKEGKKYILDFARPPQHEASSGRIFVRDARLPEGEFTHEFFPHVLDLKWVFE